MDNWTDKEIFADIGVERDELSGELIPVLNIDGKTYSWEEFGRQIESYEGWQLKFKLV